MYMTENIKKWLSYIFYDVECRTGSDFTVFCKDLQSEIEAQLKESGFTIVKFSKGYFLVSGFISDSETGKYVYFNIGDVRDTGLWHDKILIRSAASDKDYTGGWNHYTSLDGFGDAIRRLFKAHRTA